jgi:hypothetical protein
MTSRRIRTPRPLAACVALSTKPTGISACLVAIVVALYPVSSPLAAAGAATPAPKTHVPAYAGKIEFGKKGEILKNDMSCDMYQNSAAQGGANADKRAVMLTGGEARRFMTAELSKQRPAARDISNHAIQALTKKGFRPTDDLVVLQFQSKVREAPTMPSLAKRITDFFFPTLNAQQEALYYNEGVMWYTPWDDGDSSTWEGQLGALDYASGNYADGGVQIRVNNINYETASVDYLWNDGNVLMPAWYMTSAQAYESAGHAAVNCIGVCLGATLLWCAFYGPATLGCVGVRCTAGWGACMVSAMWSHYVNRIYRPTCIWVNGTQYCS